MKSIQNYILVLISSFIFFYGLAICITIALFIVYAHVMTLLIIFLKDKFLDFSRRNVCPIKYLLDLILSFVLSLLSFRCFHKFKHIIRMMIFFEWFENFIDYVSSSGLVQTAFISFYSTYLVWSSLSSNPSHGGNQF